MTGCYLRSAVVVRRSRRERARLYKIWMGMNRRCHCTTSTDFKFYGAKGIRVCDEWRSYDAFRAWAIKNGYRKNLTLDRYPNGAGNYGPSNCRWATRAEQTYNTSVAKPLTLNGVTKPLSIWAKELGTTANTLRSRRKLGWTDEQIAGTPVQRRAAR